MYSEGYIGEYNLGTGAAINSQLIAVAGPTDPGFAGIVAIPEPSSAAGFLIGAGALLAWAGRPRFGRALCGA